MFRCPFRGRAASRFRTQKKAFNCPFIPPRKRQSAIQKTARAPSSVTKCWPYLSATEAHGHCRHLARPYLRQTGAYAALRGILGSALSQRDMSDWLEDWRDNLAVFNAAGEALHILQAGKAARTLSVEHFKEVQTTISETRKTQSAFEQIEAKSEFPILHALASTCVPYEGLPPRQFLIHLNIITSGPAPTFRPRMMQEEAQQEAIVQDFKALAGSLIGDAASIIVGTFDYR
jgi:uncharacterized protein YfdQ (DUF2303 family)